MTLEERIERAIGAVPFGIYVADMTQIEPHQLRNLRPGRILMASSVDAIRFIPSGECLTLGCVAGFISDEDAE